jgi:Mycothiol maleylpyruvate isomerase N-terminal domain
MVASYRAVTDDVGTLDEDELARPSRCQRWSRADLLFHMLLDAQRALVTFATPAAGEPDVDFISYWTPFRPGAEGYAAHARFVRRAASSYRSELVIAGQWAETAAAAAHVAATLPADVKVATQVEMMNSGLHCERGQEVTREQHVALSVKTPAIRGAVTRNSGRRDSCST